MSFRRPPSDVDRMTSLRVDNLPYSAVMEVAFLFSFNVVFFLNQYGNWSFVLGPAASVWAIWGCWWHLLAQGTLEYWQKSLLNNCWLFVVLACLLKDLFSSFSYLVFGGCLLFMADGYKVCIPRSVSGCLSLSDFCLLDHAQLLSGAWFW